MKMFWKYLFCKKSMFLCSDVEILKVHVLEKENSTLSLERSFPFKHTDFCYSVQTSKQYKHAKGRNEN